MMSIVFFASLMAVMTRTGAGDRGLGRRRVGDVERDGVDQTGVLLGELGQRGGAPDGGDHRLARLGGGFGDRPAEAAAGSGDEPDLGVGHWGTPRTRGQVASAARIGRASPATCGSDGGTRCVDARRDLPGRGGAPTEQCVHRAVQDTGGPPAG